jgi:hypothetical protein
MDNTKLHPRGRENAVDGRIEAFQFISTVNQPLV